MHTAFSRTLWASLVLVLAATVSPSAAAGSEPASHLRPARATAQDPSAPPPGAGIGAAQRDDLLGKGWRTSTDIAWTAWGDSDGFRVFAADEADGYQWRTVTSLSEPGIETSNWIGNACATSDDKLVVAYAPREFTNRAQLNERGAFVAIVDLVSGRVRKLPVTSSLAYFSPACSGSTAVVTQEKLESGFATRLMKVDSGSGHVSEPIEVPGQLTSAVPTAEGIVAADAGMLVKVADDGRRTAIARTQGVAFSLTAAADGSVVYLDQDGARASAHRVTRSAIAHPGGQVRRPEVIADGPLTSTGVTRSASGVVTLTGDVTKRADLPSLVRLDDRAAKDARSSTRARLLSQASEAKPGVVLSAGTERDASLRIDSRATGTNRQLTFRVAAGMDDLGAGSKPGPFVRSKKVAGRTAAMLAAAASPTDPSESERTCSVPRNDPRNQAMQPKPRQVEWAADQAVKGVLDVQRPENWKNLGMPAYSPQGLFPLRSLSGGGQVPAQILLGVFMQESNLWQASRHALPGVTGNPLVGNYYGLLLNSGSGEWKVQWSDSDCGYGVSQLTDGMRLAGKEKPGETALPYQTQRAVALDFAVNVAAGLRLLQDKWNQAHDAGMIINNGDPSKIENWFFAVWAYNSGLHPASEAGAHAGAWGVGWLNNPANPRYPANRPAFLDTSPSDAAHPQNWPYPEKVIGFAAQPLQLLEAPNTFVPAFRPATWLGGDVQGPINRTAAKPPVNQFCDSSNQCVPGGSYIPNDPDVSGEPAGPCAHQNLVGQYDLECWYHQPSTWKSDCSQTCGIEFIRFVPGYAYQEDATTYAPLCSTSGLPSGAKIIDDVPDGVPSVRPDCPRTWTNAGTFTLSFKPDFDGTYPGKIDFHQIGGGFGGHFWFAHTRTTGRLDVSATWKLSTTRSGALQIYAALPDHGAQTSFANYAITTATGVVNRVVKQPGDGNRWVSLGVFKFNGYPQVTLTSVTANGTGDEDVAFDAVAFVPRTGTLKTQSIEAVSEFDEDQDITVNGKTNFFTSTMLENPQRLYNWGLDNSNHILASPDCTGTTTGCIGPAVKNAVSAWRSQVVAAGYDPVNHPDGNSIGTWIGFAQKYTDRPTTTTRPTWFSDDGRMKIRAQMTATYLTDLSGKIIPGSEYVEYTHRTGNTHLPEFLRNLFTAIQSDYGIAPPDLTYSTRNLNEHNGAVKTVDPVATGVLPGRAYSYGAQYAALNLMAGSSVPCLQARYISGGSIGYRAFLGAEDGKPAQHFDDWIDTLRADPRVPEPLHHLMDDVYETFFDPSSPALGGSPFVVAAPIWLELYAAFCPNGSVKQVDGWPLVRASWMPDVYQYHNGKAMSATGGSTLSKAPILKGDFQTFSAPPDADYVWEWPSAYGSCEGSSGRSGNPWDMSVGGIFTGTDSADFDRPTTHSCNHKDLDLDPANSSP